MRRNINSCKWFCIEIKTSVQQKFSTNSTNSVHPSSLKSRDKTKYRFEAQPRRIQHHLHSSRTFRDAEDHSTQFFSYLWQLVYYRAFKETYSFWPQGRELNNGGRKPTCAATEAHHHYDLIPRENARDKVYAAGADRHILFHLRGCLKNKWRAAS